jgi:hypothetical protein
MRLRLWLAVELGGRWLLVLVLVLVLVVVVVVVSCRYGLE